MKLHELQSAPALLEEINQVWQDQEALNEAVWDTLKSGFAQIGSAFNTIKKAANNKGELNDKVIRQMYVQELGKFREAYDIAPDKVKGQVDKWLAKAGIKMQGVDVSRKNFNRIMVLKVLRLILFTMAQMRDNGIQWVLSTVVSGGIATIVTLLMDAKDAKAVGSEIVNSSKQLKILFNKARETNQQEPPE
jgi:hypothetical protein